MSVGIRPATVADLDAIMAVETPTFAPDDWSREAMLSELRSPHTSYLVARDDTGVIGYAGVLAPSGSTDADIQTIAVVPEARRKGTGRALMTTLIGIAASAGSRAVFLEVRADNPGAKALYESLGFAEIAVRPRYYRDGVDAVVMRLELERGGTR